MTERVRDVSRQEFADRFRAISDEATSDTEGRLGGRAARRYRIAFGEPGKRPLIGFEAAVDLLFAESPLFPLMIDIVVIALEEEHTILFVRPSDHTPVTWTETANASSGRGPFKILVSEKVNDRRRK